MKYKIEIDNAEAFAVAFKRAHKIDNYINMKDPARMWIDVTESILKISIPNKIVDDLIKHFDETIVYEKESLREFVETSRLRYLTFDLSLWIFQNYHKELADYIFDQIQYSFYDYVSNIFNLVLSQQIPPKLSFNIFYRKWYKKNYKNLLEGYKNKYFNK